MVYDRELAEILAKFDARLIRLEELGPPYYVAPDGITGLTVEPEAFDKLSSEAVRASPSIRFANLDPVKVERLCAHHEIDHFNAGDDDAVLFNDILRAYYDELRADRRDISAVYCAVVGRRVVGYVAITPLELSAGDRIKRYVLIPALATDEEFRAGPRARVLLALLRRVLEWREARDPEHERYSGVVAIPGLNPAIDRFLRRLGFAPVSTDPFFWVGAFPRIDFFGADAQDHDQH